MSGPSSPAVRIVAALVAIAVLLALIVLALLPATAPIETPDEAKAGDLALEPCTYDTEDGPLPADCGTLIVAEDPAEPATRLLALPVVRIHARTDTPGEPIFRLEGGPGLTNMTFPMASRYLDNHDVVLVGYRGIDGSMRLECPEVEAALMRSADYLGAESLAAYGDAFGRCSRRLAAEGIDTSRYGLVQHVDDAEAARTALGYDRINLLSESAGTRTAMIYGWRHPDSIHRSVLVTVNPPGQFLYDEATTDLQLARYAELCAQDPACAARTADLAASIAQTSANMPQRWLFLRIKPGNVSLSTFFGLMQTTQGTGPAEGPAFFDAWLSAAEGDSSGFWVASLLADLIYPHLFVWGQYASAAMIDAQAAQQYFARAHADWGANLGLAATAFAWGGGSLGDEWPPVEEAEEYARVPASPVPTLIVSGELDVSTPPRIARTQLLPHLPNGHEVVLPGFAHTPSFWHVQPEAGTRLVTTYFDSGQVDASGYVPVKVGFSSPSTLGTLAKQVLAILVVLCLAAILTLVLTWWRVHAKGAIGSPARLVLRTAVPVLQGLGGWAIGCLVVLTALPTLRIDNRLVVVVSIASAVGLGVLLAWRRRDVAGRTTALGSVLALTGALAGAWVGVHGGPTVPWGLVLALAGAIAGANLPLIVLDIVDDRPWQSTRDA